MSAKSQAREHAARQPEKVEVEFEYKGKTWNQPIASQLETSFDVERHVTEAYRIHGRNKYLVDSETAQRIYKEVKHNIYHLQTGAAHKAYAIVFEKGTLIEGVELKSVVFYAENNDIGLNRFLIHVYNKGNEICPTLEAYAEWKRLAIRVALKALDIWNNRQTVEVVPSQIQHPSGISGNGAFIPVITYEAVKPVYTSQIGTGSAKTPHLRSEHLRRYKSGKVVQVRKAMIHKEEFEKQAV